MKSLKLYYFAYRNKGIFYEAVVNTILDDLVATLKPRRMTVSGDFAVRGGTDRRQSPCNTPPAGNHLIASCILLITSRLRKAAAQRHRFN